MAMKPCKSVKTIDGFGMEMMKIGNAAGLVY
jgi:hypothetical protein